MARAIAAIEIPPETVEVDVSAIARAHSVQCRLCHGRTEWMFNLKVLHRHDVSYWRCSDCGSLQTDEPHWLEEAYATSLTISDVGAVNRCLTCRSVIWLVLHLLRMPPTRLLDYGGGSGLLCRLLRDIGIDAWTYDAYGSSEYALAFRRNSAAAASAEFGIVTAFELFEHLAHPEEDLAAIFGLQPEILLASTEPYVPDYDPNWWYLSPNTGQHIFFYSPSALKVIAERHHYTLLSMGGWHIFSRRPIGPVARMLLPRLARSRLLVLWRAIIETIPTSRYISRDHQTTLLGGN